MKEAFGTPDSRTNSTSNNNVSTITNCLNIPDYFRSGTKKTADRRVNRLLTMKIHNEFSDIITCIGCFDSTIKPWVRKGSCHYQVLPVKLAYALQKLL